MDVCSICSDRAEPCAACVRAISESLSAEERLFRAEPIEPVLLQEEIASPAEQLRSLLGIDPSAWEKFRVSEGTEKDAMDLLGSLVSVLEKAQ